MKETYAMFYINKGDELKIYHRFSTSAPLLLLISGTRQCLQ